MIFKRDLSKAYKQFFYCPGTIHLLGFRVAGKLYFDITLCMGAASSALYCQKATNLVTHIYGKFSFEAVNYLDDLGGTDNEQFAVHAFEVLEYVLQRIGFKESKSKACRPGTRVPFLGILFDTVTMTLQITEERMKEIKNILEKWDNKEKATLREAQSLLGKLSFAGNTVRAGRIFVSRLINEMKSFKEVGQNEISEWLKKDLKWWSEFMADFDGISLIPSYSWQAPGKTFTTDACLIGCGGWCKNSCFAAKFPDSIISSTSINERETMGIIIGLKLWIHEVENSNVLVYCDNSSTGNIINTGRANNHFAQACLREICMLTARVNAVIKVVFKEGETNTEADILSRKINSKQAQRVADKLIRDKNWVELEVTDDMFDFLHKW